MNTNPTFLKIAILSVVLFAFSTQTQAQVELYGVASSGGSNGVGTVFSFVPNGSVSTIANLNSRYAAIPSGGLFYASDGNFYASSMDGGYGDSCAIFRCTPTGTLTTMINLDSVWGASAPDGNGLIEGMDGNLYGMTVMGGSPGQGVIFKLELTGQYSELHFFSGGIGDGATPYGSLIQTADGLLWGMTSVGGNGAGVIFNCTTSGSFNIAYSFNQVTNDGTSPHGDLMRANDGNFYGLTTSGGKYGFGTLFRFTPPGTFTKLVDFNDTNGATPFGSLVQASDGNLYGLTSKGGIIEQAGGFGTLFTCTLAGKLTTLLQFNDSLYGANPEGSLMQASDGYLYGVTSTGGANRVGTIFQYSLSHIFAKQYDFTTTGGNTPMYEKLIEVDNLSTGMNSIAIVNSGIYPNPNNGQFTIKSSINSGLSSVEIYNTLGEKIYSQFSTLNSPLTINLNQPNGVYLYRVLDENGNVISNGKFVIEK